MMRRVVASIFLLAAAVALVLVAGQGTFPVAAFEYGQYRTLRGVLHEQPYPMLGSALLVGPGKHGAGDWAAGRDGQVVELRGARIARGNNVMFEVLPDSVRATSERRHAPVPRIDAGEWTLDGEIVDSKCYLGVMNPGAGTVHRECASRCIRGGVPPAFVVRDEGGRSRVLLLTGVRPDETADLAGEPARIRGRLWKRESYWELQKGELCRKPH